MENFAAYECIDQRSQNFAGEFDNIEKLKNIFSSYPNFYQHEPPYPYISIVGEDVSDGGERKRVGLFFMAK